MACGKWVGSTNASGRFSNIMSVAFSPDNSKLASGSDEGMMKLWDVTNGVCLHTIQGHSETVSSVSFSPDGSKIASGSMTLR